MGNIFTDEELKKMGLRTVDLLIEAIETGDSQEAKNLAKRMYSEFSFMHDYLVDWVTSFMDHIYKSYGEDAFYQALMKVTKAPAKPSATKKAVDFRSQVQGMAHVLRGHLEPIKVEEDDEKVCMQMQPCGSGQRLVQDGGYSPPRNLTMIQKPHPLTWGLTDFPIYCTHCPFLVILSIEQLGHPAFTIVPGEKIADDFCKFCMYKDPKDIPEEIYTMLGKQKPKDTPLGFK